MAKKSNSSRDGVAGADVEKDANSSGSSSAERTTADTPPSPTSSSSADAAPIANADTVVPRESVEQAGVETDKSKSNDPSADASNAAPPPITSSDAAAAPLFAVTMVKLAGKYYEPDAQIEEARVEKAGDAVIAALLAAGAIREG